MWLWLVFEKPRKHPTIDVFELKYIEKSLGESVQQAMPTIATTPWNDIVRSKPVIAIVVANFCRSWNFYMLVLYQSAYLKETFKFETAEVMDYFFTFLLVTITRNIFLGWTCGGITTLINDNYCTFRRYAG